MRPLILSGGPAAGKTTCGRILALERARAAYIDADDIRQLVVSGDATLWSGRDGEKQLLLAAHNVAAMARNFAHDGFDVAIADFVTAESLGVYRQAAEELAAKELKSWTPPMSGTGTRPESGADRSHRV